MAVHSPRERFADLVRLPDDRIDVAEGALLIAAEAYPGLDVTHYLRRLADLAAAARPLVERGRSLIDRVRRLIGFMAVERGFRGNEEEYYDRRNSFLNEVLDRRMGIPITLAIVYMDVGQRLGLPVQGVGFPGHFLAKCAADPEIIIDPFFGRILSESDCAERLRAVVGPDTRFERRLLEAATPKEILVRMLRNLKQVYLQARELDGALTCSERILLVDPDLLHEVRDRGLIYQELECFAAAQVDLERFLNLAPDDPTADVVRERLIDLQRHGPSVH